MGVKISDNSVTSVGSLLATDMIPLARVGNDAALRVTGATLRGGVINVKDYGAVGDGATDETAAIQAVREVIKANRIDAGTNASDRIASYPIVYFPPGAYLITEAEALMNDMGSPSRIKGLRIVGASMGGTQILYQPAVSGALFVNNDDFYDIFFENIEFNCNDTGSDFLYSGGVAQNYHFTNVKWSGDWRHVVYVPVDATGNSSEWYFDGCKWTGNYTNVINVTTTVSDDPLNFWFVNPIAWLTTGNFLRLVKGGHVKIFGGDFEHLGLASDTYFFELLGGSHSWGVCSFHMSGTRFELRDDHSRFLYSEWTHGTFTFVNVDQSSSASGYTSTVVSAKFRISYSTGLAIKWTGCQLIGRHEFEYPVGLWEDPVRVDYDNCFLLAHTAPSDFFLMTAIDAHGNAGGVPCIRMRNCVAETQAGNETWNTDYNWQTSHLGMTSRKILAINNPLGGLPYALEPTVEAWLPPNAIITWAKIWGPSGGTIEDNEVTYTLQTNEAAPTTILTITDADPSDGFTAEDDTLFFVCDSDLKRHLTLIADANVAQPNPSGLCLVEYIG
jgi:hypothetical protein